MRNSEVQGPLPASSRKGVAAYIRPVTKAGDTTGVLVLRRSAVRREGRVPGLHYGVVQTRGRPLGASNGPDSCHHTRTDRHRLKRITANPYIFSAPLEEGRRKLESGKRWHVVSFSTSCRKCVVGKRNPESAWLSRPWWRWKDGSRKPESAKRSRPICGADNVLVFRRNFVPAPHPNLALAPTAAFACGARRSWEPQQACWR